MTNAVSQEELGRMFDIFSDAIKSLQTSVNTMNEMLQTTNNYNHQRYSDLSVRVAKLETKVESVNGPSAHKPSIFSEALKYPKMFMFVCLILCAGFVKVCEVVAGEDNVKRDAEIRHVIEKVE